METANKIRLYPYREGYNESIILDNLEQVEAIIKDLCHRSGFTVGVFKYKHDPSLWNQNIMPNPPGTPEGYFIDYKFHGKYVLAGSCTEMVCESEEGCFDDPLLAIIVAQAKSPAKK